ncbi:IclR family transcriptional regulator [Haloferax sp. Atlit-6N]|uniref:IclR family transcriptional regulator n=1 Tax=unclassified Haloferax TaxID=2625095 RepID=UPI000E289EBB|nr:MULTISPECIES: IclR family transcriptional regulator [unclassified Haloferax]RDZ52740.1 IclR family transcriptional regulator [Haloferax sp. Atlit-4N]REA02065.1 IclR family transcriptional regulator [Haloferax sp. Atlit-6N]
MKTTHKLFRIIEELRDRNGARVSELATELELPKSTVHRHLKTLEEREYVMKTGDLYHIGSRFLYIGMGVNNRHEAFAQIEPKVKALASETDERAQFMIEEHGYLVYIYRETGEHAVQTNTQLGKRMPIHATSGGKAILAQLTDDQIARIIERHGLPKITENTITDEDELYDELREIRDEGVSFNDQEYIEGLRSVSVPVIKPNGQPLGAIGISGPQNRFKGEFYREELPDKLLGVVNEVELNMKYQ